MSVILVSACLLGFPCRYRGDSRRNKAVASLAEKHLLIPVCPEQMGGLSTPRPPAEKRNGRMINAEGIDVTEQYEKGAEALLMTYQLTDADFAILKARSPACGKGEIYDGSFTGTKIPGNGIAAALLLQHGIAVYTEEEAWPVQ